jgi:hypothetical protein
VGTTKKILLGRCNCAVLHHVSLGRALLSVIWEAMLASAGAKSPSRKAVAARELSVNPTLLPRLPITAPVGGHNKEDTSRPLQLRRSSSCLSVIWEAMLASAGAKSPSRKAVAARELSVNPGYRVPGWRFCTGRRQHCFPDYR